MSIKLERCKASPSRSVRSLISQKYRGKNKGIKNIRGCHGLELACEQQRFKSE